jgi:hypothetical protein
MLSVATLLDGVIREGRALADRPVVLVWPLVFFLAGRAFRRVSWLYVIFVLPGTVLHEGAHWLSGLLLGARPARFSVMPKFERDGICLGHVGFSRLRWWNALPVGLAPLILLPVGVALILHGGQERLLHPGMVARGYLAIQCLGGCCPSSTDLGHAGHSALIYSVLGLTLWFAGRVSGFC